MEDKEALNMELLDTIRPMMQEGLVNDQFGFLHSLKETADSCHLADIITQFCMDTPNALNDLTKELSNSVLDYNLIMVNFYKVKGSALSLGAHRVAIALVAFEQAIHNKSKEECLVALNRAKYEYIILEKKLRVVLQLERRILGSST